MTTYRCVDGPLAGRTVRRPRVVPRGRSVTLDVVDVEHGVLAVDYRVLDGAPDAGARLLRFVAARDIRARRRRLRWLAPA